MLNYLGIRTDFLDYTVDRVPTNRGIFSRARYPHPAAEVITATKPDYLVILLEYPGRMRQQMGHIPARGGQFVTLILTWWCLADRPPTVLPEPLVTALEPPGFQEHIGG